MTTSNVTELQRDVRRTVAERLEKAGFTPAPTTPTPSDSRKEELSRAS